MQKKTLQDVVVRGTVKPEPPLRLGRRDDATLRLPNRTISPRGGGATTPPTPHRTFSRPSTHTPSRRNIFFIAFGVCGATAAIMWFFLPVFSSASVTVHIKRETGVYIDGTFTLKPENGDATYTTVTFEHIARREVEAGRQEQVEEFASGEITIFNTFDENPQRLVRNTRFVAKNHTLPNGDPLVYRIRDLVDIPGVTINEHGERVPGSVVTKVYADAPGPAYNLEQAEFVIPGFEGSPRYNAFFARTRTALSGGFSGKRVTLDTEQEEAIREQLREEITQTLYYMATTERSSIPDDAILFEKDLFLSFEPQINQSLNDTRISVGEKGVLTAVTMRKAELMSLLATAGIAQYDKSPVTANLDALEIRIQKFESGTDAWDTMTYVMRVRGTADFEWLFDEQQLKKELAGMENNHEILRSILREKYPGIEKAEISMHPFWRRTLPENPDRIKVHRVSPPS